LGPANSPDLKTTPEMEALQRDAIAGPGLDFAEPALVWPARHVY
jgi:hypothetical protein